MRLSVSKKGLIVVAVPVIFYLAFLAALFLLQRQREDDLRLELQTRELTRATYQLLGLVVDAGYGIRGYLITGDETFIEPFEDAVRQIPPLLDNMKWIAGPGQVAGLERQAQTILEYHQRNRLLAEQGLRAEAVERVQRRQGKVLTDAFRGEVARFLSRVEARAAQQRASSNRYARAVGVALVGGAFLSVLIAALLAQFFARSFTGRLRTVLENTNRLERDEPLSPPLAASDEISDLDAKFHGMAQTLKEQHAELRESNSELEAFSYSVSHDLRAPVRAMNGYARMLMEDYGENLDDEARRYLSTIQDEARRMGALIDDLLAFSRLGRQPIRRSPLDLRQFAERAFAESHSADPKRKATLRVGDVPLAQGDPTMIYQVLANLFSNAFKYSSSRDETVVEFGGEKNAGETIYRVRDNGVGFEAQFAGKLFGIFQRLHSAEEFEGTGVGLAIVKRIIERHGGRVWAESSPGAGATFYFTLPEETNA